MMTAFNTQTVKVGNKLIAQLNHFGGLPDPMLAILGDPHAEMLISADDVNGHYAMACLTLKTYTTAPACLQHHPDFIGKTHYQELSLTYSSLEMEPEQRIQFYETLYRSLQLKYSGKGDFIIVMRTPFEDTPWIREAALPYETLDPMTPDCETIGLMRVA